MLKPLKLDAAGPQVKRSIIKINLDGLIVGIVTGLVGVGGGFLIVPALVLLGGLGMHKAVATSLIIVALKSFTGFFKYIDVLAKQDLSLDWEVIGLVSGLGIVGSFIGSAFATKLPQAKLRRGFAIFLILMGLYILIQSISQLG
jgi:uncharacterized membrane protein YfcA